MISAAAIVYTGNWDGEIALHRQLSCAVVQLLFAGFLAAVLQPSENCDRLSLIVFSAGVGRFLLRVAPCFLLRVARTRHLREVKLSR